MALRLRQEDCKFGNIKLRTVATGLQVCGPDLPAPAEPVSAQSASLGTQAGRPMLCFWTYDCHESLSSPTRPSLLLALTQPSVDSTRQQEGPTCRWGPGVLTGVPHLFLTSIWQPQGTQGPAWRSAAGPQCESLGCCLPSPTVTFLYVKCYGPHRPK